MQGEDCTEKQDERCHSDEEGCCRSLAFDDAVDDKEKKDRGQQEKQVEKQHNKEPGPYESSEEPRCPPNL